MIKRLAYVLMLTASLAGSALAKSVNGHRCNSSVYLALDEPPAVVSITDTTKTKKQQEAEDKKKIKEIAKARRQAKPEKIATTPVDTTANKTKVKPPRQRRPDGLVRPPEIPRRNNN